MEGFTAYDKALAALLVGTATWAASLFGVEVPATLAVLATTVLVYLVPNREDT